VTHFSRLSKIVIDVPPGGHDAELSFWQAAIGRELTHYERFPEYHGGPLHGDELGLLVQRIDEGQPRVHLDIHTDDIDAEVARLERAGAQRVRLVHAWWMMRDPAGLLFCVVPEPPGSLNDDNAWRWD
jgi:hypothetical protein